MDVLLLIRVFIMQIITEQINFYNKHLKQWKIMSNFAENVFISFIKLMLNSKLAKENQSYIKLAENDLNF
jgi:hypothetical protein